MQITITVLQQDLTGKENVIARISELSLSMTETENGYVYYPRPGTLFTFLSILRDHNILYHTHFG
jgi:hypothetical protein